MKKLFNINLIPFLLLAFIPYNCSESKKDLKTNITTPSEILAVDFNKLDVCGCSEQATKILDQSIRTRKAYKNIQELKKNSSDKNKIVSLAKSWTDMMSSCFNRHAAKMFEPSGCNDLKKINQKKIALHSLGIQIDQGENIKL